MPCCTDGLLCDTVRTCEPYTAERGCSDGYSFSECAFAFDLSYAVQPCTADLFRYPEGVYELPVTEPRSPDGYSHSYAC